MRFLEITPLKIGFVSILFVLFFIFSLRSLHKAEKRWQKVLLMALRCISFILFSTAFLRLSSFKKTYSETKGKAGIIIDTSGSMFAGEGGGAINRIKKRLGELLKEFSSQGREVDLFTLDEKISPSSLESLLSIENSERETKILDSLEEFFRKMETDYDGLVLFSDGIDNSEKSLDFLKEKKIPINTVKMPPPSEKDVWIDKVEFPTIAFKKVPFSIKVVIKSRGISGWGKLKIFLNGELHSFREIYLKKEITVVKEFTIDEEGSYLLHIVLSPFPGELTDKNNYFTDYFKVIRDKIRVLQVVGTPTWDVRFLRRFLKKNISVELISFMILRTRDDYMLFSDNELSLIPFPTREIFVEAIDTFDVVIFQNFNYAPYGPVDFLYNLKRVVQKGKTGFIMLGGDRAFYKGEYSNTSVEEIAPVRFIDVPEPYINGEFRAKLTKIGEVHPITSFLKEFIEKLPPFHTINLDIQPKKDSLVLLTDTKGNPIIVLGESEKGRCVVIATNSLWEWYFDSLLKNGFEVYTKLMQNILNWVTEDPYFKEVSVEERGEKLIITVRDKNFKECKKCKIDLKFLSPDGKIVGERNLETEGNLILKKDEIPSPSIISIQKGGAQINYPLKGKENLEFKNFTQREKLLERIAELSGGRYFEFEEFKAEKARFLSKEKRIENWKEIKEVWTSSVFIFLFFGVIMIEWTLRRKWGMR
jgi:hypothetical protein